MAGGLGLGFRGMDCLREKKEMKILKGNFGECRFCDNMDETYGLPSLEAKSWDLCLTDPPWLVNYKIESMNLRRGNVADIEVDCSKKQNYKDDYSDEWQLIWFNKILNLCNCVINCVGRRKEYWWIRNTEPIGTLQIILRNSYLRSE